MVKALKKVDAELLPTAIMVRQPIYDENLKVVAYKLLYKDLGEATSTLLSNSEFAIQVMLEEYTSVYDAGEIKCLPAYIRLPLETASSITGNDGGSELIVELDARQADEPVFGDCLEHLAGQGLKIALAHFDDESWQLSRSAPLLNLVNVVRMDINGLDSDVIEMKLQRLQSQDGLLVLAENIDTVEILEECVEQGFDLFQGQFLSKPRAMSEGKLNVNQSAVLQLIAEIQKPDTSPEAIEAIVQMDPVLTYKLLRIVNSAAYSLVREVTSIADTIVMLGLDQVRQLAIVISTSSETDKPMEMYRSMLMRGHMCEVIARKVDSRNKSAYFLAGIMSGLHLLLDTTPINLLGQLPVTDDIKEAILEGTGAIGEVLKNASNYEEGSWDKLPEDIDIDLYEFAYMEGIKWVNDIMGSAS